jgi:hypothetical protein
MSYQLVAEAGVSLAPAAPGQLAREPGLEALRVSGPLTDGTSPVVFPWLFNAGLYLDTGKTVWCNAAAVSGAVTPDYWVYAVGTGGVGGWKVESPTQFWTSAETPATPDLVVTWVADGTGTGAPVLAFGAVPDALTAEGGASLAPAAPGQITAESIY